MGNWVIHIQGTGAHHNGKPEVDADLAAARLVEELLALGHSVSVATFTAGGTQDLRDVVQRGDRVRCVINGVQSEVLRVSTYANILVMAGGAKRHGSQPTITYYLPGRSSGMLEPGKCLVIEEGTVFNVCDTSQA